MPAPFVISPPERKKLNELARSRKARSEDSKRARIVLALASGCSLRQIGCAEDCSVNTVILWRDRFVSERLSGLYSRHRGRQSDPGSEKIEARIIHWTLHRKAPGSVTQWSSRTLAAKLKTSQSRVVRVWAKAGLQPHRLRRYMSSNDPDFETKAAEVIGLYLKPPVNAVVFSVDEKTAIQALDRLDPVLPLSPGRAECHGFEYFRHGTLSLYAALDTQSGEVVGKTTERHTSAEFVAFLGELIATQPAGKEIHIIADNLSAHKTKRVTAFLEANPALTIHYTPTYSSWLNQVEIWFSRIQRDLIARGVFTSKGDLSRKILNYIRHHNKSPRPFKWTYRNTAARM
jgi:transposase